MEDSDKKLKDQNAEKEEKLETEETEVEEDEEIKVEESEDMKEDVKEEDPSVASGQGEEESEDQDEDSEDENPFEVQEKSGDDEEQEDEAGQSSSDEVKFHGFNPNETKRSDIFYEPPQKKKSMKKFIIWLTVLSILALAAGFFATTTFKNSNKEEAKKVEATATPTPTPTPEPKPEINKAEWSLEVLNGSGISGQAKRTADEIKALGYTITKTGNADKQTYEQSQIYVTEKLKEKVELLITDLKDVIRIATIAGILKESTPSARIIIGKDIQ